MKKFSYISIQIFLDQEIRKSTFIFLLLNMEKYMKYCTSLPSIYDTIIKLENIVFLVCFYIFFSDGVTQMKYYSYFLVYKLVARFLLIQILFLSSFFFNGAVNIFFLYICQWIEQSAYCSQNHILIRNLSIVKLLMTLECDGIVTTFQMTYCAFHEFPFISFFYFLPFFASPSFCTLFQASHGGTTI